MQKNISIRKGFIYFHKEKRFTCFCWGACCSAHQANIARMTKIIKKIWNGHSMEEGGRADPAPGIKGE
jgi:hypothetical protein